jgi:hypothetical protein
MDRTTKIIALIGLANIIMICVASSYIPSTGGTVPQDMELATFQAQQQQMVYASIPFKITMGGLGGGIVIIVCLIIRGCIISRREERIYRTSVNLKPALKVRRTAILPEPVPHVVIPVTELREAVKPPPSISPPAQLVPGGFELLELKPQAQVPQAQMPQAQMPQKKIVQYPGELRRTFKYPPPYDVLNK